MTSRTVTDASLEHAIRAWTRRQSGTWTDAEESNLQAWIMASREHQAAVDRVARLWADAGELQDRFQLSEAPTHPVPRRPALKPYLIAACVAILVVAGAAPLWRVGYHWWHGAPVRWSTGLGRPEAHQLADGTRVLLDANSELVVTIGAHTRHVWLVRGEALFTVVHDAARAFEVEAGPGRIRDLGTRFDVETLAGTARVSVLEGRVGVFTAHGELLLGAGSGAGYDSNGNLLPARTVDESDALSGEGQRHFAAEPLSDVVARLERYHAVKFVFADPQLQQLRVSGTFRIGDLPLFLRTLGTALPLEARWLDPRTVEFRRRTDRRDAK